MSNCTKLKLYTPRLVCLYCVIDLLDIFVRTNIFTQDIPLTMFMNNGTNIFTQDIPLTMFMNNGDNKWLKMN